MPSHRARRLGGFEPLLGGQDAAAVAPTRPRRYLLAVAVAELSVLYLTVADMVAKPSGIGASSGRYGGIILALGFLAAAAIAVRARVTDRRDGGTGVPGWRIGGFEGAPVPAMLGPQEQNPIGASVDSGSHQRKGTR